MERRLHSSFRPTPWAQHLVGVSVDHLGYTSALIVVSLVDRESQLGIGVGCLLLDHEAATLRDFWSVSGLGALLVHSALKILLAAHLERDLVFHEFGELASAVLAAALLLNHFRLHQNALFLHGVTLQFGPLVADFLLSARLGVLHQSFHAVGDLVLDAQLLLLPLIEQRTNTISQNCSKILRRVRVEME